MLTIDEEYSSYDDVEEFTFHQLSTHVDPKWILLDADIFCNPSLLTNIRDAGRCINIHFIAGPKRASGIGTLKNYGNLWFIKSAIANTLVLSRLN